eukprot:11011052-Alexandrium_andersonii.AAC.1
MLVARTLLSFGIAFRLWRQSSQLPFPPMPLRPAHPQSVRRRTRGPSRSLGADGCHPTTKP